MDFIKLGPFRILKILELVIYKLDLPDSMKIAKIKHILVLKLADLEVSLMEDIPDINPNSQKKVWEIKKIINSELINNNKRKYLIKLKKYPLSNNTWEPIKNLYYSKKLRKCY